MNPSGVYPPEPQMYLPPSAPAGFNVPINQGGAEPPSYQSSVMPPPMLPRGFQSSAVEMNPEFNHTSGEDSGEFTSSNFTDKSIRHAFIRKVYILLSCQLAISVAIVSIFLFVQPVKLWVQRNMWFYIIAYVVFFALYLVLVCVESIRRKHPLNLILLFLFTLAFSYLMGTIASYHNVLAVVAALALTTIITVGLTIFAIQTKIDFTMCSGLLCALLLVLIGFGFISMITWFISREAAMILQIVYGALGAIVFSLFLVYDTQMLVGGRRNQLSAEEYVYGALQLYIDICQIFLMMLSLMKR